MSTSLAAGFLAGAGLCAVAWSVLYPRFLARLRARHAELWQRLGAPKVIDFQPRRTLAMLRFLLKREYLAYGDAGLASLAAGARASLIGTCACGAAYVAYFFFAFAPAAGFFSGQ
jgi:hypothetical protein